jgi:hypothetical protein
MLEVTEDVLSSFSLALGTATEEEVEVDGQLP